MNSIDLLSVTVGAGAGVMGFLLLRLVGVAIVKAIERAERRSEAEFFRNRPVINSEDLL